MHLTNPQINKIRQLVLRANFIMSMSITITVRRKILGVVFHTKIPNIKVIQEALHHPFCSRDPDSSGSPVKTNTYYSHAVILLKSNRKKLNSDNFCDKFILELIG